MPNNIDISKLSEQLMSSFMKTPGVNEPLKWWQNYTYPQATKISIDALMDFCKTALFFQATLHQLEITCQNQNVCLRKIDDLNKDLKAKGLKLIFTENNSYKDLEMFFIFDTGAMSLSLNQKDDEYTGRFIITSSDIVFIKDVLKIVDFYKVEL